MAAPQAFMKISRRGLFAALAGAPLAQRVAIQTTVVSITASQIKSGAITASRIGGSISTLVGPTDRETIANILRVYAPELNTRGSFADKLNTYRAAKGLEPLTPPAGWLTGR